MSLSDNALAAIAKGKTAQFVADAYGLSRREVVRQAHLAGYRHDPTSDAFQATSDARPIAATSTPAPTPPVVPVRPAARDLLSEAAELAPGSKKIGRALAKANEALKALNDVVIEDRATAELRGEEQRLADKLRRVREQLRGGNKTSNSTTSGVTPKQIREWAAANDIECPARGKVPNSVREAYDAAQADAA
jgi:hypothetical protein